MPVNTPHPSYLAHFAAWTRIETCLAGPDAIKAAGETYLPKIPDWDGAKYAAYKERATFFNATGRTHEAMLGFLFRKPPQIEMPAALYFLKDDADCAGNGLTGYAREVASAACSTGRAGTLVDWNEKESRPYLAFYCAKSIINWRTERVDGKNRLTLLVLEETGFVAGPDDYTASLSRRFRELRLKDGQCIVQMWELTEQPATAAGTPALATGSTGNNPTAVGEPMVLLRRGVPLDLIPFSFHGAERPGPEVGKAPMTDISAVNVGHYQTSACLENGRWFAGTPTVWAKCFGADNEKLYLGTSFAWTTENPAAECGFLEFTGQGLTSVEAGLKEKQELMAALGARLIEPRAAGADAEAYETVALRASAETSTLARVGMLISETLSEAVRIAEWWAGTGTEVNKDTKFTVNADFSSAAIKPEFLTAIMSAFQQGLISRETLFFQMQRGEMFAEGRTLEEELDSIDANPPLLPMPAKPVPGAPAAGPPKADPAKPPAKPKPKPAAA